MMHACTLSVRILAAVAVVALGVNLPHAKAVTQFDTNNANWTLGGSWSAGVPDNTQDGEIPSGFVALGNGLLSDTNVTVKSGGTLRVTSADRILSGDLVTNGFIIVESGGRMEYTGNTTQFIPNPMQVGTVLLPPVLFPTPVPVNTINLLDGASIGRQVGSTAPTASSTHDNINIIGTGAEVHFRGVYPGGRSFTFKGALTGDSTSTLYGGNLGASNGVIGIDSTYGANTFAGQTIVRSSDGTNKAIFAAGGINPLGTGQGGPVIVEDLGVFRMRYNTGVTATGIVNVLTGGRVEVEGGPSAANPSSGNTINLQTGTELGRGENVTTTGFSTDAINIDDGATVTFKGMTNSRRLVLSGPITADENSTILVTNDGAFDGYFQINSAAGNAIDAQIIVTGTSADDRGRLAAGGVNPLGSGITNHLVIGNYGLIELMDNTGLQSATDIIEVQSNGRVEISATSSSGNRIQMATNTIIARPSTSPTTSTSNDIFEFATNATIQLYGSYTDPREYVLAGPLSGTNVTFNMSNEGSLNGELRINSASGNALSGNVFVSGDSTALQGVLGLQGTSPLGTMNLEIQEFGRVLARAGSLDNQPSVTVLDGGTLRFRANGSTWTNSTLKGDGFVRSETVSGVKSGDSTLQALTLNDVLVSPGTSAGTLTIEATTLTFGAGSTLEIELGSVSDLLVVEGSLDLTAGPTLSLLALPGLNTGDYVIATYSGSLTGEFGSIESELGGFGVYSIDYGILNPGSITLTIAAVPEPTSGLLTLCGLVCFLRRKKGVRNLIR